MAAIIRQMIPVSLLDLFCDSHIGQHQVHILVPLPLWVGCEYPLLYLHNMALPRPLWPSLKIQLFSVFLLTGESELRT